MERTIIGAAFRGNRLSRSTSAKPRRGESFLAGYFNQLAAASVAELRVYRCSVMTLTDRGGSELRVFNM
jgi:hypothetical protein